MAAIAGLWTLALLFAADNAAYAAIFLAAVMGGYHIGRTSNMEHGDG